MQKVYVLDWNAITTKEIKSNTCYWVTSRCKPTFDFDEEEMVSKAEDAVGESISTTFISKFEEKGYHIEILSIDNVKVEIIKRYEGKPHGRFHQARWAYAKFRVQASITFTSDKEIMGSPIAPALLVVLKYVLAFIATIIIAWFAIEALKACWQSLTTEKWEITEVWYDEEGNIIREKHEKGEKPKIPLELVLIALGMALIFAFFMFGFPRRR